MLSLLKEIIIDFQILTLKTGIPRTIAVTPVSGKASVYIGVRRAGKSTFMFQLIEKLVAAKVPRENILYINFFDDRLHDLRHDKLGLILEAYFSLYPEKKDSEKIYCFFDEIQVVLGWEPFIDRLQRTEKCEVYITGSSAQMLSKEIATQMRGRALSWEIFPLSFQEFLTYKQLECTQPLSTKKRLLIQNAFADYWETGGFPEVITVDYQLRLKIHQEYFNAMLFRDLIERHDISHPKAVSDLAHWLMNNAGSLYSINKLCGYLKSLGHKVPKSAVADYISWFDDAYILFSVQIFDASLARANTNAKKIYCIDHSLVCSISSGILVNSGHLLENLVFVALRRTTSDIFYYKSKEGQAVDFVIGRPQPSGVPRMLVQVCESLADPKTKARETSALIAAMTDLKLPRGIIVTRNEDETIANDAGVIDVVSAWRFVLEMSSGQIK